MLGGAGNDTIYGGDGSDTMSGGSGNDTLDGWEGTDTVVLTGRLTEYVYERIDGNTLKITDKVSGRDGADLTIHAERIQFSDRTVDADDLDPETPPNTDPTDLQPSTGSIAENAAAGSVIATLSANDAENDPLTFELRTGSDSRIILDGNTLKLADGVLLDFEAGSDSMTVNIRVSDGQGGFLDATRTFTVTDVIGENTTLLSGGTIKGDAGADWFSGSGFRDLIYGGLDADTLIGNAGADLLSGGKGNDSLDGGAEGDRLFGGGGADALTGGDGVDRIVGGRGADDLTGGLGKDTFVFNKGDGGDRIMDFDGSDMIEFKGFGTLDAATFLSTYAHNSANGVVFDVPGADGVTLVGITDLAGLSDSLLIG